MAKGTLRLALLYEDDEVMVEFDHETLLKLLKEATERGMHIEDAFKWVLELLYKETFRK